MSGEYGVIPVADYKDICDAVREKTHTDALMLPPEVAAKIRSINPTPTPGEWVRPDGWPDLDSIDLTGFDGVYLTYDLSKTEGYGWIGLYATTADRTSWTVERGHLEAGQFVAERTEQTASGGFFRESLDDTYGTIQLWRVSASGHITELKLTTYGNRPTRSTHGCRLLFILDALVAVRGTNFSSVICPDADTRHSWIVPYVSSSGSRKYPPFATCSVRSATN